MAKVRRIGDTTDIVGEGPVWCPHEQALYWVDILAPVVRRWRDGETTSWKMPESVGSLALCAGGGILVALRSALSVFDPATGAIRQVAAPRDDGADMRFNDGKCDRQGRFWAGTMVTDPPRSPRGRLYRLDPKAGCEAVLDGISIPNSLCWSPDGGSMYFADSVQHTIWAFSYDPATGAIGERRVFVRTDPSEAPDGGTVDAEGYVWSARFGGARVVRHAPDGRVDRVIELPARQITSCAFGGADLSTLFITTATHNMTQEQQAAEPLAGALLAVEVGVRGLLEPRYAG